MQKETVVFTTTICLLSEANNVKDVHVGLETGLLIDSSTA